MRMRVVGTIHLSCNVERVACSVRKLSGVLRYVLRVTRWKEVTNLIVSRTALERPTKAGDSPVDENDQTFVLFPEYPWSRLSVVNLGLLRSKAKYF